MESEKDGFFLYPVNARAGQYWITGADSQILTVALQSGERVKAEPGVMMHMSPNMDIDTNFMCSCGRICGGESCVVLDFVNKKQAGPGYVGLSPNFPGKVIPVDLANNAGGLVAKRGAFMASMGQVNVDYSCDTDCWRALCGGMGCVRQKLHGSGMTFLAAGGTILQKNLGQGETILVDTTSVLGWSETVSFDLKQVGGCLACCCGGEGMYYARFTGPGLVLIESMSWSKYKARVAPPKETAATSSA